MNTDTQLITVTEDKDKGGKQTVNARELHEFLDVGKRFPTWIKSRICQYGFVEGKDFIPVLGESSGGRPSTEYHISLGMAKELSMVERNAKGREARRYFIQVEEDHFRLSKALMTTEPIVLRKMADLSEERTEALKLIEEQKSAVAFTETVAGSTGCIKVGAFAKVLYDQNKLKIGRNRLFRWLKEKGYLQRNCLPYQQYIDMGLFEVTAGIYGSHIWQQTLVTGKGVVFLTKKILDSGDFEGQKPVTSRTFH